MYSDIQILCQGFYWNQNSIGQNYGNISFFNQGSYSAFTNEADLTPFIINDSLSPLSYEFEDSERGTDSSRLYFTPSDISFSVSDIDGQASFWVNGQTKTRLRDFFQILSDTTYIKYLVKLKYKGSTVFQGVVSNESLEEAISTKDDSHIIKISVLGFEKEIKDYFSNKKLSDYNYGWTSAGFGVKTTNNQYYYPRFITFEDLLNTWFRITPATGFRLFPDVSNVHNNTVRWYVFDSAFLTKFAPNDGKVPRMLFNRCSFLDAVNNNETVWSFLVKLCNSMGWIFYIRTIEQNGVANAFLYVKNRYTINKSDIISVNDGNKLTPQILSKVDFRKKFYSVYIPNGTMDTARDPSWDNYKYINGIIISSTAQYGMTSMFLKDIHYNGYYSGYTYASRLQVIDTLSDTDIVLRDIKHDPSFLVNEINYLKNDVLVLDTGESPKNWRTDLKGLVNLADPNSTLGTYDIQYKGNYGSMMSFSYLEGSQTLYNWLYSYEDYTSGAAINWFENNMRMLLLGKSTQTLELSIYGIETDPLKSVLINDEYYSNKYFGITEMTIDFINDTTKFKLIQEL